ncbi:MAG: hypothetical protein JRE71_20525 [Deltaproteobacteria bacterium]|nr:hypothetical protein [Deltaproteobacteria bacterium]
MARDRRDPVALSLELDEDRSSTGRQPVSVIGRLSALPFSNGVLTVSLTLLCPSPEPEPNQSSAAKSFFAVGQTVALKRPARGYGLVSRTVGFGSPPLLNAEADPEGVFIAGSQRAA